MVYVVGDWEPLGSSFVARHELYQMAWGEQDLSTRRWANPA